MAVSLELNQLFSNNAISLLAESITTTSTSLTVMAGHGSKYPQPTGDGSDYFLITLENQSATTREIIKVTERVGDVLIFALEDRGLEGTTVQNWSSLSGNDTLVDHRITAETLTRAMRKPISTSTGALRFNQPFTMQPPVNGLTVIALEEEYQTRSVQLYVGGLRQKLDMDYEETAPGQITLQFELTQEMIDEGQNVTIDFMAM